MRLAIQLLGAPQFQLDDVPVTPRRRAVVALLAYLAVNDMVHPNRRYTRETLAALLWTDYDSAKALTNLRHTLWEVAQFIGEGWVSAEHESVYLKPSPDLTLDVAQFRSLLAQSSQQPDPARQVPLLVAASGLYHGDFLSGFTLKEGGSFNEWAWAEGESLRRDFASILKTLVEDYCELDEPQRAVPYAQRLIALDPIHEVAHRQLMQVYALTGQHTAAIQQYHSLEKLLRKELNLDPQPETRELYKRIRKGELKPVLFERSVPSKQQPRPKHNLPVHLTSFIGREKTRDEISSLVSRNRLATLIGPGGMGKTRLSLEVGRRVLNQFEDGVWFIPLDSLDDEDLVPQTVASLLGIPKHPDQVMVETLANELRPRTLLLILDNCEHLLDACAQLTESLLQACPNLKILATSRDLLRLEGEASFYVPPLTVPEGQDDTTPFEELLTSEAVQLFAERAALAAASFKLTRQNIGAVVRICNRLDGIPLAIELAAARVDILSLDEILKQLERSFDLLASDRRSILPRHQTMRTSIDWGWKLLTDTERVFVRQLSVFMGGWTLHAAQTVSGGDVLGLTSTLLKKSFVVVQQQTEHETRYGFHEVVRAYAQEKLVEAGEEQIIRDRHLAYILELLRQLEPALHGVDQDLWLERLFFERDNIRAALGWAAKTNVRAGLYLSERLRTFWESYDLREEARWLLMI